MMSQDYTKEINLDSGQKIVSWPVSIGIMVVLAVAAWFGVRALSHASFGAHSTPAASSTTTPGS